MTEPKIHVSKFNSVDAPGRYQYNNDPKMTDKEREEINSVYEADKKNGVTISTQPTAYGPSQALMEQKLKMYIRAGLVVDKNDDGEVNKFSNKNERALGRNLKQSIKKRVIQLTLQKFQKTQSSIILGMNFVDLLMPQVISL